MLEIRSYDDKDFNQLNDWLVGHGHDEIFRNELPALGYVACRNGQPVAMAFLRLAEGNVAMAESMVSNPQASTLLAADAVHMVIEKISQVAKDLNIKQLIAWTVKPSVARHISKHHGYKQTKQITLVKTP
jgi:hypothetical protein